MASKFIKYQDYDGNNIPDVCDDLVAMPAENTCLECKPNPSYVAPSWRDVPAKNPKCWYNEKNCKYQVAVSTKYTSLIPSPDASDAEADEYTENIFQEHQEEAVEALLIFFNKETSTESLNIVKAAIEYENFDLDTRAISYVKLLYSVPQEVINDLKDAEPDENDEEDQLSPITVTFSGEDFNNGLFKIRKALKLYSRYLSIFRSVDKGNMVFLRSGLLFNLRRYEEGGPDAIKIIQQHLEDFLSGHGLRLKGGPVVGITGDRITAITFRFSNEYELIQITALTEGCGNKPFKFGPKKLKPLTSKRELKDKTALAYIAQSEKMLESLTSREPMPWIDFLTKYTYPEVVETFNWPLPSSAKSETALSCVGDALAKKGVQLGEDLLDSTFSIADSFVYLFRKNNCLNSVADYENKKLEPYGLVLDPAATNTWKDLASIAKVQAYKQLENDDAVFVNFCFDILKGKFGKGDSSKPADVIDEMWPEAFDRLKACGLAEFMLDSVKCLMAGLTFEQAMSRVIEAALQNMSVDNLGKLFVGLPASEQQQISDLVQQKIDNGDVFKPDSENAQLSSLIAQGADRTAITNTPPWSGENSTMLDRRGQTAKTIATEPFRSGKQNRPTPEEQANLPGERRTLAQQTLGIKSTAQQSLNEGVVLQLYIKSLIEYYSENLLELMDALNKFPGAPLIAETLAYFDCPTAPIFEPSYFDFIKDVELPFCKNGNEITLPVLQNPFGWIPEWKDFGKIAFDALKLAIQNAIILALQKLMVKICRLLGSAMCKIGGTIGSVAFNAVEANNRNTLANTIAGAICGGDQTSVNDTILDMFEKLGVGGAALSNQEDVIDFTGDVSSMLTRSELMNAFLGNMDEQTSTLIGDLIESEYPQFLDGLPDNAAVKEFFDNMGKIFPEDLKNDMRAFLDSLDPDDYMPANPTMCATPEAVEDFCNYRTSLLRGRATASQAAQMCENYQNNLMDEIGTIADALHGDPLADALPPLVSDPGCDNGLIPFESPEDQMIAAQSLTSLLKQLLNSYSEDMLGNGPNEKKWGMINMILSDTQGVPLTAHYRRTYNRRNYVDFIELNEFSILEDPEGMFPKYVAEWLRESMSNLIDDSENLMQFSSSNEYVDSIPYTRTYSQVGISPVGGVKQISLPDFGYDTSMRVDTSNREITFIRNLRKKNADISMRFTDANKGLVEIGSPWSYGFDIDMFLSEVHVAEERTTDMYSSPEGETHKHIYFIDENGYGKTNMMAGHSHKIENNVLLPASSSVVGPHEHVLMSDIAVVNIESDNARININNLLNQSALILPANLLTLSVEEKARIVSSLLSVNDDVTVERSYEFLATDDTLKGLDYTNYPEFLSCFNSTRTQSPQVVLFNEIMTKNNISITLEETKTLYNNLMSSAFKTVMQDVINNDVAWEYGAVYDNLTREDAEYVVGENQTDSPGGTAYNQAVINGNKISEDDMVMGMSKDQFLNGDNARVFYLDPGQFGGSYMNPKIYIKPLQNEGWLGFVDVMFPELSPCDKSKTDLINLKEIEDEVSKSYKTLPEDERLKENDDCIVELPYNRILERTSKAGIQGLIKATCRIYASIHLIKSMATFSKFAPRFEEVCSSIFAQFVVEDMEKSLKDSQGAFWEAFNVFKDEEFWYAFLEQSVQTYGRLIDEGAVVKPPMHVLSALNEINDMQEGYKYPTREDFRFAKSSGDARGFETFKNYKERLNYEAIKSTEEQAKIVLKEMVKSELNSMGDVLMKNMGDLNLSPDVHNLDYYLLTNLCQGSIDLELDKDLKETVSEDILTNGSAENLYSNGGQFTKSNGEEYIGFYHVHEDDEGALVYMAGAYHHSAPHEVLNIFANKLIVPIGDVEEIGFSAEYNSEKPFVIEKYVKINGVRMTNETAQAIVRDNDDSLFLSDIYPGTLRHVFASEATGEDIPAEEDMVVGLAGELGVRYGVALSVIGPDNTKKFIVSSEVDALDTLVTQFAPLDGNSKMLLCLMKKLVEKNEYKMLSRYILPINKIVAMTALYNNLGFLPSIGEKTAPIGQSSGPMASNSSKPGMKVNVTDTEVQYSYVEGWASAPERMPIPGTTPFVVVWDEWDQVLLRNSRSTLKRLFKTYYNSRTFDVSRLSDDVDPFTFTIRSLKGALRPTQGHQILPRWKRSKLVSNPFDAKGNLCEK